MVGRWGHVESLEEEETIPSQWACKEEQMRDVFMMWPKTQSHSEGPAIVSAAGKGPELP